MGVRVGRWHESGHILQERYRIVRLLGRGGMGAVYLCDDLRIPDRRWALKEMFCADAGVLDLVRVSFRKEAEMLSRLRHRHLPVVVDHFEEGGKSYVVMEYIEGETLEARVERDGALEAAEVTSLATQLTEVLAYLHGQDPPVIFRDLKPSNVMISPDGTVRLVDFGLARLFDPAKSTDTQVSGSVGFTAPEQWDHEARSDQRSDIYSWGATVLYALSGRSPAIAPQARETQLETLSKNFRGMVRTCLNSRPEDRYGNVEELLEHWQKEPMKGTELRARGRPRSTPELPKPTLLLPALVVFTVLFLIAATWLSGRLFSGSPSPTPVPDIFVRESKAEILQLLAQGDAGAAIPLLEQMLARSPADAEAQILLENARALLTGREAVKVAVLTSLSGPDRDGYLLLPGLAMAQQEINSDGGIQGKPLLLDLYDDGSRVAGVLRQVRELTDQGYSVVIGPWTSQHLMAAAPLINEARIPMVAPSATDPRVWDAGPYLFTATQPEDNKLRRLAQYLVHSGKTRTAVIENDENIASRSSADLLASELEKAGGTVVFRGGYRGGTRDFEDLVDEIIESDADSVYMADWRDKVVVAFARRLRDSGSPATLLTKNLSAGTELLHLGGEQVEGLIFTTGFHTDVAVPGVQEFCQRFRRRFPGQTPREWEARAYDTLYTVVQGMNEFGPEPSALRDYLAALGQTRPPYPGVAGPVATGAKWDDKPYLLEVRNGRFQLVEDETER